MFMKTSIFFLAFLLSMTLLAQNGDDGLNHRIIPLFENDVETARVSVTFVVGFDTQGHDDFHG